MAKMTREERGALDARLRKMSVEEILTATFGREAMESGQVFYDETQDLWIAPNPTHEGDGFGFIAMRRDHSWFCGVIPANRVQ